ncbi:hypothetical protein LAZ67_3004103 [Cordylochernes scorpioides]|uniref:Gag-pol polyprotein n=1 Tax=Cordylochernes scorpioides TaxID=51811 RepID=A0ABY6KCI4_9ARAC|nr:hypothetical protein LAZ67_3004103 [Cordylochernes scorpioides]
MGSKESQEINPVIPLAEEAIELPGELSGGATISVEARESSRAVVPFWGSSLMAILRQYLIKIDFLKEDVESQLLTGDLHVLNQTKENLNTLKLNLDSQVLKLAKYKSLDIAEKFKITYNAVKEIDGMLVSINRLLDGIKQDKSTSEEFSIKLPKFQLPIFSGNFSEWLRFKEIFIKVIDQNRALPNSQKLQYLVSALRGDARLVRAFSISDENYSIAWQNLIHRYDNKRELAFRQIQKFLNLKFIKGDSDKALYEFLDICNEGVQNLSTLGLERNTLVDLILIYIILSKLDNSLKKDWELHIDVQGYHSYEELITFLEKYARSLANLRLRETSKSSPKPNKLFQERWRFVRDNGLCYNCLRSNHLVYACKLTAVCGVCKLRHHTLLHAFSSESHDSNSLPGAIHAVVQ